jgi:hypothetical protein
VRKVILQEFVTLNGLAAGPDDSVDFIPASTRGDRSFGDDQFAFLDTIDTILLGRVTYRMFARHWPNVTEGEEKPFADKLNAKPKIVSRRHSTALHGARGTRAGSSQSARLTKWRSSKANPARTSWSGAASRSRNLS